MSQKKENRKKNRRTTISGYYIHDVRKAAKFCFEDFLICVKLNELNHCYDIFLKEKMTIDGEQRELSKEMLSKFVNFYPKSLNVIVLSEIQADLLTN
jgi:hypothetical protein